MMNSLKPQVKAELSKALSNLSIAQQEVIVRILGIDKETREPINAVVESIRLYDSGIAELRKNEEAAKQLQEFLHLTAEDTLSKALSNLDVNTQAVIIRNLGLDGQTPESFNSIAAGLNLTTDNVEKLFNEGLEELRKDTEVARQLGIFLFTIPVKD